jgi:hypothetical protein
MPRLRRFMALSATNVSRSALARPSSRAVRLPTSRILRRSNFPAAVFAALSLADTLLQLMEIIPGTEGAGSIVQLNEATGPFQQKQLRQWICRSGWPPVISEEVSYVAPVTWIWCDETKAPSGQ